MRIPDLLPFIAALALLTITTGAQARLAPETPDSQRERAAAHLTFQQLVSSGCKLIQAAIEN